jgi:PQQ-dependent catabolism-associated CXXCW motif protein
MTTAALAQELLTVLRTVVMREGVPFKDFVHADGRLSRICSTRRLLHARSTGRCRLWLFILGVVALPLPTAFPSSRHETSAPEPSGYWTGPVNSPVPLTLSGGTVISKAHQLRALLSQGGVILIDVSNAPRRPENLAPGAPWLPVPHRAIPGSLWIPDVGLGEVPVSVDDFFRQRLADATGNHLSRPVVIYCHRECWLSWNAAKRAISYGYRNVYWYRDGVEGWKAAGYRTAVIEPQVAPGSLQNAAGTRQESPAGASDTVPPRALQ